MSLEEIVETTGGRVRGLRRQRSLIFKGIPYGDDTGGPNRFLPPQPVKPWAGVRDVRQFGPSAPQFGFEPQASLNNIATLDPGQSEDCLVLNICTPGIRDGGHRPVMFWCHGGAYSAGNGDLDPERIACREDVVVVSVNHRLNVFGHLALDRSFGEEFASAGNAGLLDIAAALQWVRDNIAGFGGDPDKVLIFGVSGGGSKTAHALAMPAFEGLFRSAIVMAGHDLWKRNTIEAAERTTNEFLAILGVARGDIAKLRAFSAADLLNAFRQMGSRFDPAWGRPAWKFWDKFSPVIDGCTLPEHPADALAAGASREIELIVGLDRHDHFARLHAAEDFGWMSMDRLREYLRPHLADRSAEVTTAYAQASPGATPSSLLAEIVTDFDWRIPALRLVEAKAEGGGRLARHYFTAWTSGAVGTSPLVFDRLAAHNDDYVDSYVKPYDTGRALAGQVSPAFAAMARDGNPNHSGLPRWPVYSLENRETMVFDFNSRVENDFNGAQREALRGLR